MSDMRQYDRESYIIFAEIESMKWSDHVDESGDTFASGIFENTKSNVSAWSCILINTPTANLNVIFIIFEWKNIALDINGWKNFSQSQSLSPFDNRKIK